jgi:hypothetical protein
VDGTRHPIRPRAVVCQLGQHSGCLERNSVVGAEKKEDCRPELELNQTWIALQQDRQLTRCGSGSCLAAEIDRTSRWTHSQTSKLLCNQWQAPVRMEKGKCIFRSQKISADEATSGCNLAAVDYRISSDLLALLSLVGLVSQPSRPVAALMLPCLLQRAPHPSVSPRHLWQ